jgi:tetratricopeptide (TPR) repeat protein
MRGQWIPSNSKVALFVLAFYWATVALAAEWYKEYETAIDNIKKGRYGEAIPHLRAAIAQKNQEGLNIKFYGMKFDDYLPHYYLGKALFNQQNYQAALNELELSSSQGEIQKNRNLFQNLNELKTLSSAQIKPNQVPPPVPDKKPEPVPVQPQPQPSVTEKKPDVQESKPVPIEPVPVTKTQPVEPAPSPQPSTEELTAQRVQTMVKEGARRYFQGDFDSAISSFSGALRLNPDNITAQFLTGCSYAAKYLLSGSSDQKLLEKASAYFHKTRRSNPNHPMIRSPFISPAVREIYEKTGP